VLDRVESLLADLPAESAMAEEVRGEVDALRSVQYFLAPLCDGPRAFAHARRAMERNPPLFSSTRTTAVFMLAMLHQLNGNLDDAFEVVYEELERKESRHNVYHARLLITLCSIYWVEADLGSLTHVGRELWKISGEIGLPENRDFGQFFLGIGHYCRNEPAAAEENLKRVVNNSSMMNISIYAHSACALSLAIQAQGRSDEAGETAETVARRALNSGNIPVLKLVHALQAELALRQGNLSEAVKWAEDYHPEPFQTAHRFFVPQLTFARILLAQATAESRQQTADLLLRLHEFYQSIHNRHCLMNVLALQARLHNDLGDEPVALASLERAISMAEPGGFVRIFLDLGPDMAGLLRQLSERGVAAGYIGRLLAAFQGDEPESRPDTDIRHPAVTASNVPALPVPLTNRELEVLSLLAMRLSNKELSGKLFISAATVKRHLSNLYAKLEVHGRREVVDKATSLGILS